jgi:hypothetical protein
MTMNKHNNGEHIFIIVICKRFTEMKDERVTFLAHKALLISILCCLNGSNRYITNTWQKLNTNMCCFFTKHFPSYFQFYFSRHLKVEHTIMTKDWLSSLRTDVIPTLVAWTGITVNCSILHLLLIYFKGIFRQNNDKIGSPRTFDLTFKKSYTSIILITFILL